VLENLRSAYDVTEIKISSGTKIEAKVKSILTKLGSFSFNVSSKPNVIMLHAKAGVVAKLISIVEIAKREISQMDKNGQKWYQYNRLDKMMIEKKRKTQVNNGDITILGRKLQPLVASEVTQDSEAMDEDEHSQQEESTFETMKLPHERAIEGKPIKRMVPGMTIYLSRVRIDLFKNFYE
jgi:hypothetical protein